MITDSARATFRRELGFPESGRIVMTGHQCTLWHAGILAKYIWCDRAVQGPANTEAPHAVPLVGRPRTTSALVEARFDHAAWLWVDQDTDETHTLRVPVRANGRLESRDWKLKPAPTGDIPGASTPTFRPALFTGDPALPQVSSGIERATRALEAHAHEPNAARQFASALADLMSPHVRPRPPIFATSLLSTAFGRSIIEAMQKDPRACVRAYNRAAEANPQARIAALVEPDDAARIELPLWRLRPNQPRERVTASALNTTPTNELAPRALLMTGMVRAAACDLFIHGTGGGIYDTITEAWFRNWLGVELTPTVVVTADLLLPLHPREVTQREVAAAKWKAHHARHDPAMLGDAQAARRKAELLEAISAARAKGEDPLPHYRALHDAINASREIHAATLDTFAREAAEAESMFAERAIATDRTWPFIFHDEAAIRSMEIRVSEVPQQA